MASKIQRTVQNEICSKKVFHKLCVKTIRDIDTPEKTFYLCGETIRHLRLAMTITVESADCLANALDIILRSVTSSITPRGTTARIEKADIDEWLVKEGETEWVGDVSLADRALYGVRNILARKRVNGVTLFLVDWEPTWEARSDVGHTLIVQFEKARRAIVRRTYIENKAKEAGK